MNMKLNVNANMNPNEQKYLWPVCGIRFSAFPREGVIGELRGVPAIKWQIYKHAISGA